MRRTVRPILYCKVYLMSMDIRVVHRDIVHMVFVHIDRLNIDIVYRSIVHRCTGQRGMLHCSNDIISKGYNYTKLRDKFHDRDRIQPNVIAWSCCNGDGNKDMALLSGLHRFLIFFDPLLLHADIWLCW